MPFPDPGLAVRRFGSLATVCGALGRDPATIVRSVVDTLGRWRDHGAGRIYLHLADVTDFARLDLIGDRVIPQLDQRPVVGTQGLDYSFRNSHDRPHG